MTTIKFGTDGWRAIMAKEFTFDNVQIVAQAITKYLTAHNLGEKGIVIGFDNRFLSENFAAAVAEVMAGAGITVYLPLSALPTPVTAYAITLYKAGGAVMITASHNPPEYNGIKFIPEYAGPALPHITQEIEGYVKDLVESKQVTTLPFEKAKENGLIKEINPIETYLTHLKTLVNMDVIGRAGLKVVIDPMCGAGIGYLESLFKDSGCIAETINSCRDPLFGGSLPEPSAKVLVELKQRVLDEQANLGLALDGDADRFGIFDADGTFIIPNQVLILLLDHLIKHRDMKGPVARTVATTHMLDKIALKHGLSIEETPVGFKYMGECLMNGSILAGEESGGLSIKGHIPEKDGILAAALITEIVAVNGKTLTQLLEEITQEYGALYSERLDIHCSQETKERVLKDLNNFAPEVIAGNKLVKRITIDGTKMVFDDDSWVLIRASGTEPLFRIYVETGDQEKLETIQKEVQNLLGLT